MTYKNATATSGVCDTSFTERYNYNSGGARVGKTLVVARTGVNTPASLAASYTYDNEGRMTGQQYPNSFGIDAQGNPTVAVTGPNLTYAYDSMGRLSTLTENGTTGVISSTTYGPAGNLTAMSGAWGTEARGYNAMLQMTSLSSSGVSVTYNYSATQNNGKIISQQGPVSGETITYTYDSLNRLASATSSGATPLWGQSYAYDGFGNLTDITTTQGSTPEWHQSYSAATNRAGTDVADANGNIGSGCQLSSGCYNYDVENRIISSAPLTAVQYAYAPDDKRVWRSDWSNGSRTVDEVSFWSVTGQRVATFNLVSYQASLRPVQTATEYYFGGKLIKNGTGYVYSDRLGSIGKYYPYGQERPSATANGTEKFTGNMRDAETGLDYSDQRYHSPGTGRFLTTDPSSTAHPTDPNSWNQYAYVGGDPINRTDPAGLDYYFSSDPYTDPSTGSTFTWGVSFSVGSYGVSVNPFYNLSPLDLQAYEDNSDYSFGHRFDGTTRAPASFAQRVQDAKWMVAAKQQLQKFNPAKGSPCAKDLDALDLSASKIRSLAGDNRAAGGTDLVDIRAFVNPAVRAPFNRNADMTADVEAHAIVFQYGELLANHVFRSVRNHVA